MRIEQKKDMWKYFKNLGADGLSANHYELQELTEDTEADYSADTWKEFLTEPDVRQYVNNEMEIITGSTINKMVQGSAESRSTGQAQLMSSLQKLAEATGAAKGPIFIYGHVPLNDEQNQSENNIDYSGKVKYSDKDGIILEGM